MKKTLILAGVFSLVAVMALAFSIRVDSASAETAGDLDLAAFTADFSEAPLPMAGECAKIECGTCPGPKCKIDGICCYVQDGGAIKDGVAQCGCTADGEPYCKCVVGQPR